MTEITETSAAPLFGSMLMGGFECAAQKLRSGKRLDLAGSTGHALRAAEDFALLRAHGMTGARDGLRWHLIEERPGRYDWSSFLPVLRAARDANIAVAWDLLHYGVPNGVDVFAPRFVDRFAAFAKAAAAVIAAESDTAAVITPVNEISFWAWAGGENAGLNPFARGRGDALKQQLVRASLAAGDAVRAVDRRTRIACAEPLIHVLPSDASAAAIAATAVHNASQFEALDMLLGRTAPELGGHADAVDIIGLNYYYDNQWIDRGRTVYLGDWLHRPLHELIAAVAARYDLPLYIAETGTEGVFRPLWLRYVCDEVRQAARRGVPVGGICLYPVISHLGWDDDRHCQNGLFDGHSADAPRLCAVGARSVGSGGAIRCPGTIDFGRCRMTALPVIVAIPARNEADQIRGCLAALAAQPDARQQIVGVVVFANNCTDATVPLVESLHTPFPVMLHAVDLPPERAHIGFARRGATDAGIAFMRACGLDDAIIAGTDADSRVAPGWLPAMQASFANGVDAVCGAIDIAPPVTPELAALLKAEAIYADLAAQVAHTLDAIAHDPWPNHIWCWGANFAVRARMLAAVGGSPLVDLAEDRALHANLLLHDARIRHSNAVRVVTSARAAGRAPGGFADLLTSYACDPAALADYFLEPAATTWHRSMQRGRQRRAWGDRPHFGAFWASQEACDPSLTRRRVAIADLAAETVKLKGWLAAAKGQSDTAVRAFA